MNILASYNWIKEYLDTDLSAEEFAKRTTAIGNSVERIDRLAERFDKMVVGFVKKVKPHPNADKLKVAETDIGKEVVEIVCGGINLAEGQRVVVGLPGAKVRWHGEGELVELAKTKIRGVESFGMICAVEEIGFEKLSHREREIWDITNLIDAKPGMPIVKALDIDDTIFDIEVTSNRPDCMSIIGQAREGAAIIGTGLKRPTGPIGPRGKDKKLTIDVKEPEFCPKYSAILIENIKVGPSPWWLQKKLLFAGHRPINNVVDITNYVLHEYGQPLHVFDADKLDGETIVIRKAKKDETIKTLDGNLYELKTDMLVIADAKRPIAVAGVMGGEETSTTEKTTRVLIEAATFDPVSVRRTARALNLYSDSQLLFEKGLSTKATEPALIHAAGLMSDLTGGKIASSITTEQSEVYNQRIFRFHPNKAKILMGVEMEDKSMLSILERLGFVMTKLGKEYHATVPFWRDHDIESSVDLVEEIARVYGYDNFPSVFPLGEIPMALEDSVLRWQGKTKEILKGVGLAEIYSYAFVSKDQLIASGFDEKKAVALRNPLNNEFAFMRPSLVPSMLTTIEQNQHRFEEADLFELAPVYLFQKNDLPSEPLQLLIAVYGKDGRELFLRAKGILERWMREVGLKDWSYKRISGSENWHEGRSAEIQIARKTLGEIGEISKNLARVFGIDVPVVLARMKFQEIVSLFTQSKTFSPLSVFPEVKRDLAFVLDERTEYTKIDEKLRKLSPLIKEVEMFDVYRGKGIEEGKKSLAIHLVFRSDERTLESKEVDGEVEKMRDVIQKEFGGIMRS